jgi:hypothetical protein
MIKLRAMSWLGSFVFAGVTRNIYKYFVGIPEGNRPLGRPRYKWEDDIKVKLKIIGWRGRLDLCDSG